MEKGLLVLEDLKDPNRSDGPMISLNKDKIADVKTVHIILESLAKFHGIWLCWMNSENPLELGGLNRDAIFEGKYLIKVCSIQNEFMRTSIFQNSNENIIRISALKVFISSRKPPGSYKNFRAEILTIFSLLFWKIDVFINSF